MYAPQYQLSSPPWHLRRTEGLLRRTELFPHRRPVATIRAFRRSDFDKFAERVASGEAWRNAWRTANDGFEQFLFETKRTAERLDRQCSVSRRVSSVVRYAGDRAREIDRELEIGFRWRAFSVDFARSWPRYRKQLSDFLNTPIGKSFTVHNFRFARSYSFQFETILVGHKILCQAQGVSFSNALALGKLSFGGFRTMIHFQPTATKKLLLRNCTFFQQYHAHNLRNSRVKPRSMEHSYKSSRNRCKNIPFVSDVKETKEPDEALLLFHEYHQAGFRHDYPSYSSLIYKLAKLHDFDAVETVLGYIIDRNIRCRESLFVALIQQYGKAHLVDEAINIFHKMRHFDCVRSRQSLNTLLNVLVGNGRFLDAKELFDKSHKMGFRPNSVTFNILMKGLLANGSFGEACELFEEMLERKVQPSVVTYNSLIGFLCKQGEVDKGKTLLEDMIQKGKYPNAVTYALLMEGLCYTSKYAEAVKLMFDMEYRGCRPKVVNFGVLLNDLGKRGKLEEAKLLLGQMKKRRFKPDVVIYNILVNYLCKEGKVAEAYRIMLDMQMKGCIPNATTYRMMVDGFCQTGDFDSGLKLLSAMLASGHCPRLGTFCCLVVGLLNGGKINGAYFVLEEMEKRKLGFDADAWGSLVRETCSFNEASELLSKLLPNI